MILTEELDYNRIYKKKFYLPINEKDTKHRSLVFLLSPNISSSIQMMKHPLAINKNYFISYFIEKDIKYYITNEGYVDYDKCDSVINEDGKGMFINKTHTDYTIDNLHMRIKEGDQDLCLFFNENLDEDIINENKGHNPVLRRLLYDERLRTNNQVIEIHDIIKHELPKMKRMHLDVKRYKEANLFVDMFFYNELFLENNIFTKDKGMKLYVDFLSRNINDRRFDRLNYKKKTIFLPVHGWGDDVDSVTDFNKSINPLSMIMWAIRKNKSDVVFKAFEDIDIILLSKTLYSKINITSFNRTQLNVFNKMLGRLLSDEAFVDDDEMETKKAIVADIIDRLESNQGIKVNNLTGDTNDESKKELVKKIEKAAEESNNTDEAIDTLEQDDKIKDIITQLASEEQGNVRMNGARVARMNKLNDEYLNKSINNKSVRDLLNTNRNDDELPVTSLDLDTVDECWNNLQYPNFESVYDIDTDIALIINSLSDNSYPIQVLDVKVEDTSTSEDYVDTYTVKFEDYNGTRFTVEFEIPKFKEGKFMKLRGNDKTISGQLALIPISKTDEDTVQIVTNYKKIFVTRNNTNSGKSFVVADRIIKTVNASSSVKSVAGLNGPVSSKYELPMDYVDLSDVYDTVETKNYIFYFNQDTIRLKYDIDKKKGVPFAYDKKNKSIVYYESGIFSNQMRSMLSEEPGFDEEYENSKTSAKYSYSQATVLNNKIPIILIMAYNEGLTKALNKANIKYDITEKRPKYDKSTHDVIRFSDGYILYELDYNSSLLLNGLKACGTETKSIMDINSKAIYLDFLDLFGGRILGDGLDNFYDLMIDPISKEVLEYYDITTDYVELLAYSNFMLSDNKYIKHTDLSSNRYRSNEIVSGYLYQALSQSYEDYKLQAKRGRKAVMTMKKSAVLDKLLTDSTCTDKSTINPLLDLESINTVSYKGLSGLNSSRGYSLDKRTYDESMSGVLAMSTGFAGNVGITRQSVIDMNIKGKRGYIKIDPSTDKYSVTKTLCATEAMTPMGTTRDDPFRTAMTFIQTSKHAMRTEKGTPLLISNGSDQAMPYLLPNDFSFKSKEEGTVIEITDTHMVIKYKSGMHDFVDLRDNVRKNSNGGFYTSVKLDTKFKVGNKFKANEILAYDKLSYSDVVGHTDNIAYNIGVLTKLALLNTDEGFEDSAIISHWLSDALASDVLIQKDVNLPPTTNIYNMVKKGTPIQEGDPLIIFQNSFDENDLNILLKNLADDEDTVSSLGRIPVKSKITGSVHDVKIYRTVEKEELSDSLKKAVSSIEKDVSTMRNLMKKYDVYKPSDLEPDYALESTGKLKNTDGVMIEFYLKYRDKMSIGDKMIYFSALKGVIKTIFPEGEEPVSEHRPNEKVHTLLAIGSVAGRMVCSVKMHMVINKILIELSRSVKEMAGLEWKTLDEM